ncbi:MAG: bifunctional diguanylate cyclase/phosphodiesterase [Pseudomonadales bacterium]|nr:bifunctional diguanylate cyclase/phosphodiesterase [Pseudomonadales bacterium]
MKPNVRWRQWQEWSSVIIIGVMLALMILFSYQTVLKSRADVMYLTETDLPVFNRVQELRLGITAFQSGLYPRMLKAQPLPQEGELETELLRLSAILDDIQTQVSDQQTVLQIRLAFDELHDIIRNYLQETRQSPVRPAALSGLVSAFAGQAVLVEVHLQTLTSSMAQSIAERSRQSLLRVQAMLWIASGFGVLALGSAIVMAWLNTQRLRGMVELRRQSSFPDFNPDPVLTLDERGLVLYANSAAATMAEALFSTPAPEKLLPTDLVTEVISTKSSQSFRQLEYSLAGKDFSLDLHWLNTFREYHAYIADISVRKKAERELRHLAFHDPVTSLPNRSAFNEYCRHLKAGNRKHQTLVALLEIDHLHKVVSSGGHVLADKVMSVCAERLLAVSQAFSSAREVKIFRFDGGLFCLSLDDEGQALATLQAVQAAMAESLKVGWHEVFLSVSIGMCRIEPSVSLTSDLVLRRAGMAIQMIRGRGGNGLLEYYPGLEEAHDARVQMENGLRHAQQLGELRLVYQPKVSLVSGRVASAEALLRWTRADGSSVSPADFIPIAEESNLIFSLGEWVLEQACQQAALWQAELAADICIAVNVSARQLVHGELVGTIQKVLEKTGLAPQYLEIEVTETAALADFTIANRTLKEIRALGIGLTLDDFGTGYSSLSYLQQLPINKIKIDKSFVSRITSAQSDDSISHTLINLAHDLDLQVVAEGVETSAQLAYLASWGCDEIQGYLLASPLSPEQFMVLLQQHDQSQWRRVKERRRLMFRTG